MSDEAVVRIVLVDGMQGASASAAAGHSAAGTSAGSAGGVAAPLPDRLYREIGKAVTDLSQSFKRAMDPVIDILDDIRDLLTKDVDVSNRTFVETQTSFRLLLGALGRGKGAVSEEVTRSTGFSSADRQTIDATKGVIVSNRDVVAAIDRFNANLNPERDLNRDRAFGDILRGSLLAAGLTQLPRLGGMVGLKEVSAAQVAGETGSAVAGGTAAGIPSLDTGAATAGALASELAPIGAIAGIAALGGLGGYLMNLLSPEKKEKSTNELLQEIVDNTTPITGIAVTNEEISRDTTTTSVLIRQLVDLNTPKVQIVPDQAESLASRAARRRAQSPTGARAEAGSQAVPLTPVGQWQQSMPTSDVVDSEPIIIDNDTGTGSQSGIGQSAGPPVLGLPYAPNGYRGLPGLDEQATGPYEAPDEWAKWNAMPEAYTPGQFLNPFQREYLEKSGWPGYTGQRSLRGQDPDEVGAFRAYLMTEGKARGLVPPVGLFARGGAVGTDNIPALLSEGEVVVPKYMVDGGAVDHLRGQLPGFAGGGLVAGVGQSLTRMIGDTDPGTRIGNWGSAISAFGEKIGTALPVIGGFVQGLGEGTKAVSMLMAEINNSVNKYAEYSPAIAQAQAVAEIRQTMGDFRRAQQVGADMAKFVLVQSEMQQKFEEVKIKLLMQITPAITAILEAMNVVLSAGGGIEKAITALVAPAELMADATNQINLFNRQQAAPEFQDPTDMLFDPKFMTPTGGQREGWVPGS